MRKPKGFSICIFAVLCVILLSSDLTSAAWPEKTIQIIAPFRAGGDTDFNARVYTKHLRKELGVPLVVVNIDGGGGTLGSRKAKDSAPDGYTVLFYHSAMLVNTATGMVDYTFRDFEMVGIAGIEPGSILCVLKKSKWNTLKELMEDSRANPNKITITGNMGATTYLTALLLNRAGGGFNIVDHGGASQRITALLGSHVDVIANPYGTVRSYIESGEFKALAALNEQRNPKFSNIPTAKEQGYDVVFQYPYFFLFPKGTPKEIVEKFAAAVEKVATTSTEYAAEIEKAYSQLPFFMRSGEALKFLATQEELISKVKMR
jgi:tripartite-type tricarboxylate transporter receptor subunit TctC